MSHCRSSLFRQVSRLAPTLLVLTACASAPKPSLELVGAPSIVTPQRPPVTARYDTVGAGAEAASAANEAVPIGAAPVQPQSRPLPSLEEMLAASPRPQAPAPGQPVTPAAPMVVEAAPTRAATAPGAAAAPAPTVAEAVAELPVRNPSFTSRVPPKPVPAPPRYRRLSAKELTDRLELQASFQASSPAFDRAPSRASDAAAILRVNPDVVVRVTGFALDTEQGGRTLAIRRAEMLARELTSRGAGGARIETEGRLVRMGKAKSANARLSVERAARRAQVVVLSGTPRVDPFEPHSVPGLSMR